MTHKILEITELECGSELCGGCENILGFACSFGFVQSYYCRRFNGTNHGLLSREKDPETLHVKPSTCRRLPECLEAERRYKQDYIDRNVKYRVEEA